MSEATDLAHAAAEAKRKMQESSPANNPNKTKAERQRIPMTTAKRKLELPDIPGYHVQWIYGSGDRIRQALNAGFEFVDQSEVDMNNFDLGGDAKHSGNTDLGTRVSVIAGGMFEGDKQAAVLYAMKQKKEYYDEDQRLVQRRNDSVADALVGNLASGQIGRGAEGSPSETAEDASLRFVDRERTKIPNLFKRKPPPRVR